MRFAACLVLAAASCTPQDTRPPVTHVEAVPAAPATIAAPTASVTSSSGPPGAPAATAASAADDEPCPPPLQVPPPPPDGPDWAAMELGEQKATDANCRASLQGARRLLRGHRGELQGQLLLQNGRRLPRALRVVRQVIAAKLARGGRSSELRWP
jgi:hypothetical protein